MLLRYELYSDKLYKELRIEKAFGDGNCALNAFFLALFTKEVLDELEKRVKNPDESYKFFWLPAAKILADAGLLKLEEANWATVRKAIMALRQDEAGKIFLQKKIRATDA